ncbi:unnamed protein product [Cuscuta epithymum]|uniref:Uncharacterized protein n=1 Tax=Cuscuta epithymum TaxID=186058 RepID=A0AAV0C3V9_9ASTE|nr:unnamed protein product [Cuscuta epithymum]
MRQEHDIFNAATPPVFPASTGLVLASPLTLLYMFMDPEQWSSVFSNIVSTATTLEVLFPWEKEKPNNGALQVVTWVDNSAVHDHGTFVQNMFGSLLTSNFPFSANRWISALERYYDKIVALEGQGDNNNYNGYHFQALVFSTFA